MCRAARDLALQVPFEGLGPKHRTCCVGQPPAPPPPLPRPVKCRAIGRAPRRRVVLALQDVQGLAWGFIRW